MFRRRRLACSRSAVALTLVVLAALMPAGGTHTADAAPGLPAGGAGTVDPEYGTGGTATEPGTDDVFPGHSSVALADGSVLVLTRAEGIVLSKRGPNGFYDPTFGSGGRVVLPLAAGLDPANGDPGGGVVVDAGGRIFVAAASDAAGTRAPTIVRLSADGAVEAVNAYPAVQGGPWAASSPILPAKSVGLAAAPDGQLVLGAVVGQGGRGHGGLLRVHPDTLAPGLSGMLALGDASGSGDLVVDGNAAYLAIQRPGSTAVARFDATTMERFRGWSRNVIPARASTVGPSLDVGDAGASIVVVTAGGTANGRRIYVEKFAAATSNAVAGFSQPVELKFSATDTFATSPHAVAVGDKIVVAGSAGSSGGGPNRTRLAVARLTATGQLDPSFGTAGASYPLGADVRRSNGIVELADGRLVVLSSGQDQQVTATRLEGSFVTNASTSVEPGTDTGTGAGRRETPTFDLAALARAQGGQDAELQAAPLRSSPLRSSPLRSSPLRSSPLRSSPLRSSPLRSSPLRSSPVLANAPVTAFVLLEPPSWSERFVGSRWEGVPPQAVTIGELLAASIVPPETDPLAGLTLGDIDLTHTALADVSVGSLLLMGVPLHRLPQPDGGWCAYLAGQPFSCSTTPAADPATSSLVDLELGGDDISSYLAQPLSLLAPTDITGSPLARTLLLDVDLYLTPLAAAGPEDLAQPGSFLRADRCGAGFASCSTLVDAQALGASDPAESGLQPTATLSQLITALAPSGYFTDGLTLGQVIAGLLPTLDVPVGALDRDLVLDRAELRTTAPATITTSFLLDCRGGDPSAVSVGHLAPARSRYVPGSSTYQASDGSSVVASGGLADPGGDGRYALPAAVCGSGPGRRLVEVSAGYEPGEVLGAFSASSVIQVGGYAARTTVAALFNIVDGPAEATDSDPATAPAMEADTVYAGHLSYAGDQDYFSVPIRADATPGSRLTVSLSHLPADYDLAMVGGGGAGVQTPFRDSPLRSSPLRSSPLRSSPLEDASAEPDIDLAVLAPEATQDRPFTAEAFQATSLRGSSLNRGTAQESITTVVRGDDPGKTLTVGVAGFNQVFSRQPYLVHLTYRPAPALPPCIAARDLSTETAGSLPSFPIAEDRETIILAAPSRMPGLDLAQLEGFAARDDVRGVVIPVDGDADVRAAYAAWDAEPCSVEAANRVAGEITKVIDAAIDDSNGELRHLVVVGNDDVIPQGRLIDPVGLSNEADHAFEVLYGNRTNPISAALGTGYMLADDPYASLAPFDFLEGDLLYLPNVAAGRLVETPAEVAAAIDAFVAADGELQPDRAFTAGYDFLTDGATAIHERLAAGVGAANAHLRTDEWTGQDAIAGINDAAGGFASVNAHYDQTRLLPASGTEEIVNASDPAFNASHGLAVLFTVGCHAGLNIPNGLSTDRVATGDWAERLLARGAASYLANTGYGYGDEETVAASEKLMALAAENLVSGDMTAGQALLYAKRSYAAEAHPIGAFDAKVMEIATYYGLPMWRVGAGGTVAPPALPPVMAEGTNVVEQVVTLTPTYTTSTGADGTVLEASAPGATTVPQTSHYRPLGSNLVTDLGPGLPVTGVVIDELWTSDGAPVTPSRFLPNLASVTAVEEFAPDPTEVVFPVRPADTRHIAGLDDSVIFSGVQWLNTGGLAPGLAVARTTRQVTLRVLRSNAADVTPPQILSSSGFLLPGPPLVGVIEVESSPDATGGVVLFRTDVDGADAPWRRATLVVDGPGHLSAAVTGLPAHATAIAEYSVQVTNGATVAWSSEKVTGYRAETLRPTGTGARLVASAAPGASGFYTTPPTVSLVDRVSGVNYSLSVDGGEFFPTHGEPVAVPGGDGPHVIRFFGDDGSEGMTLVVIDTNGPVIVATPAPAPNANGYSNQPVTVTFTCTDNLSGVATCPPPVGVSSDTAGQVVSGTATDRAGNSSRVDLTVRVDRTPPTITATVSPAPEASGWNREPVTITYTCSDATSGVDGACPEPVTVSSDGVQTINRQIRDGAGNDGSVSTTVRIDQTGPTGSMTSGSVLVRAPVTGTADDTLSGVQQVQVQFRRVAQKPSNHPVDAELDCSADRRSCTWSARTTSEMTGFYRVTVTGTDLAGNTATIVSEQVIQIL